MSLLILVGAQYLFAADMPAPGGLTNPHIINTTAFNFTSWGPDNDTAIHGFFLFNFSSQHVQSAPGGNVSQVVFYASNSSTNITLGTNTSVNLTNYSIRYDTSALGIGNYTLIVNITNHTTSTGVVPMAFSFPGTFRVDNENPVITFSTQPGNQTTAGTNFTFSVGKPSGAGIEINTAYFCNLTIDGVIRNSTTNIANGTTTSLLFNLSANANVTSFVNCTQKGLVNEEFKSLTGSTTVLFSYDSVAPTFDIKFKDTEGNERTEFGFGDEVTVDCNPSDATSGIDLSFLNISVKFPEGNEENQTNPTATGYKIPGTSTQELGSYVVSCWIKDYVGLLSNSTNKTFTIITKAGLGTEGSSGSAFGIPGFSAPVGKIKVSEGVTSDIGALTKEGVSRLLQKGASVLVSINGEDHKITVIDITEDNVELEVNSETMRVTISKGDTKIVDLDGDNKGEMEIEFHKRYPPGGKWADLTFKVSSAPTTPTSDESATTSGSKTTPEDKATTKKSGAPLIITIIVIAVILLIGYSLIKGKKK